MKRKRLIPIIILCTLILATIPLTSCLLGSPSKPTASSSTATDTKQNERLDNIETNKASKSDVYLKTETYTREEIDNKVASGVGTDAYPKTETYTRSEIENLIQAAVDDLEEQIDDIDTGGSSSSSSSDDDYGELVDQDGDLELWLDSIEPASDPFPMSSGGDDVLFDIVVVNNDDRSHKYDLSIRLTPEDDVEVNPSTFTTNIRPDDFEMEGDRTNWNSTPNDGSLYISNVDYIWIGGDKVEHYSINVEFSAYPMTYWDFKLFIEDRS